MDAPRLDTRVSSVAPPSSRTRPLYWSVRRELWENRSIHLAPLGVATFVVVAITVHGITMPSHLAGMIGIDPSPSMSVSAMYRSMSMLLLVTALIVGAFYCMDALSGERRDRSILFWKSLPVSDRTAVLAKASIPLVVLPVVTWAAIAAMLLAVFLLSALALVIQGHPVTPLWREVHLPQLWGMTAYAVAVIALWHAPIYAFLLMASGWARRTAGLWALLPVLAAAALEKLTMDTTRIATLVMRAIFGWYPAAFAAHAGEGVPFHPLTTLTPLRFLASPELWIGLVLAAMFLAIAVRLRRQAGAG
jgi:ABC-2 type transport system permease protein